jgi:hypothetical protein
MCRSGTGASLSAASFCAAFGARIAGLGALLRAGDADRGSNVLLDARFLGDYQAVKKGRIGRRLARRAAGRVTGRGLGRIFC